MGSIFRIRGSRKLYLKAPHVDGTWKQVSTGIDDTPAGRVAAEQMLRELEGRVAAQRSAERVAAKLGAKPNALTLRQWATQWLASRDTETVDDDRSRLEIHILPVLGDVPLLDLRRRQIQDLIDALSKKKKLGNRRADGTRTPTDKLLAPRTVHHIYGTLHTVLESAVDEVIPVNPCTGIKLPPKVDKDRTWRRTAVFARDEVELIISAPPDAVPEDRRVMYAILFLGATRFGEAAALTWRDYDAACSPLGKLVIERSYSSKARDVKPTKTDNPREMPVHPTLAKVLAGWELAGFEQLTGRKPKPEDLIVPSRRGKHRNVNHMLRRFHEDLERLGLRARRQHDARRTFISIARADGARPDILRWATHGPTGDITDVYTTLPWHTLCEEVAKAKLELREDKLIAMPVVVAGATATGEISPAGRLGEALVKPHNMLLSLRLSRGADGTRKLLLREPVEDSR